MATENLSPAMLESLLAAADVAAHPTVPNETQQALQQALFKVLQVADAEVAENSAKLQAASRNAQAWQQSCAVMQQAPDSANNMTTHAQAVAATALQDAAAAQTRATLAEQAAAATINVLSGLHQFTGQLLQLTLLLAAAFLGRSLPLQFLALLPFAKWVELVRLFMSISQEERQIFSWQLMSCQTTAAALTALKEATVSLLQQRIPTLPLPLLCALYDHSPDSTLLLLQAQQRVSMLPTAAQQAWQHAAAQCTSVEHVTSLVNLASTLAAGSVVMAVGCKYPQLLLEAAPQQPAATEAAAAAIVTIRCHQHAGSGLCTAASGSPVRAQHNISAFTTRLIINHASRFSLMLPALTLQSTGTMSALVAYSSTHSSSSHSSTGRCTNVHMGDALKAPFSRAVSQGPTQHEPASFPADAVVHLTIVHSSSSKSSSSSSSALPKAVPTSSPNPSASSQCLAAISPSCTASGPSAIRTVSGTHRPWYLGCAKAFDAFTPTATTVAVMMVDTPCHISPTTTSSSSSDGSIGSQKPTGSNYSSPIGLRLGGLVRFVRRAQSRCSHNSTGVSSSPADSDSISCSNNGKGGDEILGCVAPGCNSSRSSVKSSGFRKRFEFLHLRHMGSRRSGSCLGLGGQGAQLYSTALEGQHPAAAAAAADVAPLSSHAGDESNSSSTTSSIRSLSTAAHNSSSKQKPCGRCVNPQQHDSARGSEDGLSDAATSSDINVNVQHTGRSVWQRLQQSQEQQQQWRSAADKIRAAWGKGRHVSSSRSYGACDQVQQSSLLEAA